MSRTERFFGSANRPDRIARRARLLPLLLLAAALFVPAEARANRLAGESSPYLREHAQDPVDWYPWGEAAFDRAQKELKPIFLSIGYSACHWCHVMQRESFSDAGIARLLNDSFVAIKVDREERPDLDTIYMDAVVTTTGAGGWPMSLFLTPDLKPFQGGTYYPRDRFAQLLTQIAGAWKSRRAEVIAGAESIRRAVEDMQAAGGGPGGDDPTSDLLGAAVAELKTTYDRDHGGFGRAPKFPPHGALALLLRAHRERGDQDALQMATTTLVAMARGGLYDQVGGGFHRYTMDAAWRTPHFEKMLYDNALLVPLYLVAWRQTDRPEFRLVAEETLEFMSREMKAPSGGFAASLDADTEGEEGRYYTWTPAEIGAAVGPNEAKRVAEYFGVTDKGSLPDGRSVLIAAVGDERFAAERGLNLETWRRAFEKSRAAMFKARARRPAPARNDNVLAGWNGLAISAFATGFRATQNPDYLKEARAAAAFVLGHLRGADGTLRVSWREGRVGPPGVLEDNALLVRGLLDLDAVDPGGGWRRAAVAILADAARFEDARGGWFRAAPSDELFVRPVRFNDEALPGGNAMMVENLARLSLLTRDAGLMRAAMRAVDRAAAPMRAQPSSYPYLILARDSVRAAASASASAAKPAEGGLVATASAATTATPAAPRVIPGTVVGRANRERVVESAWSEPDGPVRPGEVARATVRLTIKSGWHINSSKPTLDYLIGTKVQVTETGGATVEGIDYPEGHLVRLAFADEQLSVYEKEVAITPRLRTPRDAAAAGGVDVVARLTYQACSDKACLPPETVEFKSRIA
ncbi:MAG TPA: DUF255 domain-containing protein, partial [Dongiaceae bacterium]|nr:DUF255 domain-containing protein [Dongiaceae bacterium]